MFSELNGQITNVVFRGFKFPMKGRTENTLIKMVIFKY